MSTNRVHSTPTRQEFLENYVPALENSNIPTPAKIETLQKAAEQLKTLEFGNSKSAAPTPASSESTPAKRDAEKSQMPPSESSHRSTPSSNPVCGKNSPGI